ncbi:DUF3097 domain-containing protein [Buchananella hordeovulneris]|uniref:DUF3097 domain-containing protein n=1 Tax=Buchananella hordeovulneris TaxID=52770 RepID=UPI000F5DA182|nr:DUF3097 domain-containing protein [Buchananella hordeovulneris]MDO5080390.1 DUF3097 domain-containing protein [Buchananella hordeovulneris]RRD45048.1 DUF3097 domain-containing protein [Buchananella hordeovulneris]RRD52584.1 DUF3097 domain-containing protein [Buchananella hordeovulneris]
MFDRYGRDVLSRPEEGAAYVAPAKTRPVQAEYGMVVEDAATGFTGAVLRTEKIGGRYVVVLENRHGRTKSFTLGPGFLLEGQPVALTPMARPSRFPSGVSAATPRSAGGRALTASGSFKLDNVRARTARASRLWVEGKHDAELVERVWGDDLRVEGVVVELLDGVGNLEAALREFAPGPQRRAGVLLDHLVKGSKETRLAAQVRQEFGAHVLIVGHPFVDVWQAVNPRLFGLPAWPQIPRATDIKVGTLQALGWAHTTQADIADGWRRILSRVTSYKDLHPALLGRVEELIDFVTAP